MLDSPCFIGLAPNWWRADVAFHNVPISRLPVQTSRRPGTLGPMGFAHGPAGARGECTRYGFEVVSMFCPDYSFEVYGALDGQYKAVQIMIDFPSLRKVSPCCSADGSVRSVLWPSCPLLSFGSRSSQARAIW
jgi:hypothetical protein